MKKIPGGKGANQAIAAQRSDGDVNMISRVGQDENGIISKELANTKLIKDFIFIIITNMKSFI